MIAEKLGGGGLIAVILTITILCRLSEMDLSVGTS